ncbi:DUF6891 domain-containing protein [Blastopirellula marina]|uniref:DUF6891 domain-containing protein n=1 Tax=Blastopirellula marina TaxID=124 RepID=A0A2S8GQD3_9BACT|nr:hypothetical protein [Blastopirellula marina]PQO46639.1 hypothetical protein C5Y93_07340 [Blastopirellula marina]
MPQLDAEVLEAIDVLVDSGFWDANRILEIVCEEMYAPGELDEDAVGDAIAASFAQWKTSQQDWPDVTDCDRLDLAFANLNKLGVIALHNAGMTQSDGYDDFRDAYDRHPLPEQVLGYCFYHGQDLERVVRGGPLYFGFGPLDPQQEETAGTRVGQLIVEQLTAAGLTPAWEGSFKNRISIPEFDWKRRAVPSEF